MSEHYGLKRNRYDVVVDAAFDDEKDFFEWLERQKSRTPRDSKYNEYELLVKEMDDHSFTIAEQAMKGQPLEDIRETIERRESLMMVIMEVTEEYREWR